MLKTLKRFRSHGDDEWAREFNRPRDEWGGLNQLELDQLATYNGERARGIVHTDEWNENMRKLQARYDSKFYR